MAGIYIPNIELPKADALHPLMLSIDQYGTVCVFNNNSSTEMKIKKAIPISDHGRLIDVEALNNQHLYNNPKEEWELGWNSATRRAKERVQDAPTIIPADEEDR